MKINNNKAVVLFSGGLDSATTLAYAINQKYDVHALSFNYGQRNIIELEYAKITAHLMKVTHRIAKIDFSFLQDVTTSSLLNHNQKIEKGEDVAQDVIPATYVPARNLILLSNAVSYAESLEAYTIFIGANIVDYGNYPDCRPEFLNQFATTATLGTKLIQTNNKFTIEAPLLKLNKAEIIKLGLSLGVNYSYTLSCYNPSSEGLPCHTCLSCQFRKKGFTEAGVEEKYISYKEFDYQSK